MAILKRSPRARFTNREEPLKAFDRRLHEAYEHPQEPHPSAVLHFYGIGGIGKSRLLNELRTRANTVAAKRPLVLSLDLDDPTIREPARALLALRKSARMPARSFRTFDVAYTFLFAKKHPDLDIKSSNLPFLEEAGIVSSIVSALEGFGLVGALAGLANQGHKWYGRLSIDREVQSDLSSLRDMTVREIEEVLPDFLAYDCNKHQQDAHCPTLLFIDTYEALWASQAREQDAFSRDEWARHLANALQSALIVSGGREPIRWAEF